jgi:hypothetical protein
MKLSRGLMRRVYEKENVERIECFLVLVPAWK